MMTQSTVDPGCCPVNGYNRPTPACRGIELNAWKLPFADCSKLNDRKAQSIVMTW
jgi:hypothetical protein